jgi:hypothetical protein
MKKLVLLLLLVLSGTALADEPAMPSERPGHPTYNASDARKACTDAMNADPVFAQDIIATVDKQIDAKTIQAHEDASHHIQKNEKHVIYAYAAMWIVAALLVAFLWMRQQALKSEIAQLRKDLEATAKESA